MTDDPSRLRDRMAALGLTRVALARLARVGITVVASWLAGRTRIPAPLWGLLDLLAAQAEGRPLPSPVSLTARDRALLRALGPGDVHQDRAFAALPAMTLPAQRKTLYRLRHHGLVEPAGNVPGWYRWTASGRALAAEAEEPDAAELRRKKAAGQRWSPEADARLIELRREGRSTAAIAEALAAEGLAEVTGAQVRTRLRDLTALGIEVPQIARRWAAEEDAILDEMTRAGAPVAEIARRLGRSEEAVVQRRIYRSGAKRG